MFTFFILNNNYTFDKQNRDPIINTWNIKKQHKKSQLLSLYCNKEGKTKDNQIVKIVATIVHKIKWDNPLFN